jgi:hypothetical protein
VRCHTPGGRWQRGNCLNLAPAHDDKRSSREGVSNRTVGPPRTTLKTRQGCGRTYMSRATVWVGFSDPISYHTLSPGAVVFCARLGRQEGENPCTGTMPAVCKVPSHAHVAGGQVGPQKYPWPAALSWQTGERGT